MLTRSDSSSHCPNGKPHFFPKRMNFRQRFSAGWEQVTHIRLPKRRPMWWWQRTTTTALRKPSNATCCKEANMDWNSCWEGIRPFLSLKILWLKCEAIKNWWAECRFSWSFCAGFVSLNDVHVCHFCLNVGQVDWHELGAIWKVQDGNIARLKLEGGYLASDELCTSASMWFTCFTSTIESMRRGEDIGIIWVDLLILRGDSLLAKLGVRWPTVEHWPTERMLHLWDCLKTCKGLQKSVGEGKVMLMDIYHEATVYGKVFSTFPLVATFLDVRFGRVKLLSPRPWC